MKDTAREISGLDYRINDMALRIRELREIMGFLPAEMAERTGLTLEEYLSCERGEMDLSFAFLYRCALAFNVDVTDIIEGISPRLASVVVTRRGEAPVIDRAHGMLYHAMAGPFKNKIAEPLYVQCDAETGADIALTTHAGQECDIVISGTLKIQVGSHVEVLQPGDSIYYDSSTPHGMVGVGGPAAFYAIVLRTDGEEYQVGSIIEGEKGKAQSTAKRVYHNFIHPKEDENGALLSLTYENEEKFNFAYDVVDALGVSKPDKLAMVHIDRDLNERKFTFRDMMRGSAQTANYFKSLGIKRGDRVMLVLKRHYQFWFSILALHKLGAIAIPATNQLVAHDFEYRFNSAGVSAIICTSDGDTAAQAELAMENSPTVKTRVIVGGPREGWRDYNDEVTLYSHHFDRAGDAACGGDLMLMFFTSGTTGYPKIAAHNFKYPLGHFVTANYWHNVDPEGLHLTISDTGWAKALWGKLYGQWLCEGAVFVFDFDRFNAAEILPMFAKYRITTFCAPPTMYRMMIKEDLTKYDLSSVRYATIAGEALNPEVFRQLKALTGLKVMEGFGQSEGTLLIGNLYGSDHKLGSMGRPVPSYDIDLLGRDGRSVGVGEEGEIVVRTGGTVPPGLFVGYYGDEEKTREVWYDGCYHTGDLAWRDEDGFYWYVGRADDVIKSSGYRIGPFEIENVIMELPYVLECGVSAEPDEVRGQVVKASVVLTKGAEPSDALAREIQEYVKTHTAPYKYPRIVVFKDELPKTTSGKIIRSKL